MKCNHHPSAPAIGVCEQCGIPICGFCARYQDDTLLCERCDEAWALARRVEDLAAQQGVGMDKLLSRGDSKVRSDSQSDKSKRRDPGRSEKIQIGVVIVCSVFIVYQIFTSLAANRPLTAQQVQAEERARSRIEDCMLVFWEVATRFSEGQDLPANLRCPDSTAALLVREVDNDLIVSHPDPEALGVSAIYVTRSNPIPILEE